MLFPRRKIITMLSEVGGELAAVERRKLAKALDSWNADEAIAATWELAVLWAATSTLGAKPHPIRIKGQKQPDGEVDLGLDRPVMFDVKSLSGDAFSFKKRLDRTTNRIEVLAKALQPQFEGTINVHYFEWRTAKYIPRQPATIDDPTTSPDFCQKFEAFIAGQSPSTATIRIPGVIIARFERRAWSRPFFDWTCSVPTELQKTPNNQSEHAIRRAKEQLLPFRESHYLGLILCDGGNEAFSRPHDRICIGRASGADMFKHIVSEAGIDFAFAVGRTAKAASKSVEPATSIVPFTRSGLPSETESVIVRDFIKALGRIPPTLRDPSSIKSIMHQDQRWKQRQRAPRLVPTWYHQAGVSGMKISARTLVNLIAGETSQAEREALIFGSEAEGLKVGKRIISDVRLESSGDNYDDDYIVIEFADDPTRQPFSKVAEKISTREMPKKR